MHRSDYIRYHHSLQGERCWAERIQRRPNTFSSPRRSQDFRRTHSSRYSPLRLPRQRSRSRSLSEKYSRNRRSRSRSPRLKFPIRNDCNNRSHQEKIPKSGLSRSTERSRSRSTFSPAPLRERLKGPPPMLKIQLTSRKKSPSAHSPSLLGETMTSLQISTSDQTSQSGEQRLQPMKSASPVNSLPRPIAPMITLHGNRVSRPSSLRRQLLPTPTAPHMFYMQTHYGNIEYRTALSYHTLGPPDSPTPANLGPFDLRHRLHTSRSQFYLGSNDLRHRIQDLCVQNTYLQPPAFNAHAQWPPVYSIDYNSSGYY
ncbi:uncharacterized protein LOC110189990 [Drosophila serrata]|uniref:uncharacterized protein LOC110189990 n=1 Tax=Drosophila serrata TaxID=7274 RepID=UPI000A1D1800|nr:uncharacterized protein LOC110189990 [Drosophila serrata]